MLLEWTLYPAFRHFEMRGKRPLHRLLPIRNRGTAVARFRGGTRLRLDLSQPFERDYLFGLCDLPEFALLREFLRGDFVDVGAHIGLYTVAAARLKRGRVLAFEPNPLTRGRLEGHLGLNACSNVLVIGKAVSSHSGSTQLLVPIGGDSSWASLEASQPLLGEVRRVEVETTTVDAEVARHGLAPSMIKVDVEGHELAVFGGMAETIERHHPALLCEVTGESAQVIESSLDGYSGFQVWPRRLRPLPDCKGPFNALFLHQCG